MAMASVKKLKAEIGMGDLNDCRYISSHFSKINRHLH